jgi:hypothetical protein
MLIPIITSFVTLLILPGYFIYELWKGKEASKFRWVLKALYSSAFLLYLFLAGHWHWLSFYLRFIWLALLVAAIAISYWKVRETSFFIDSSRKWQGTREYIFTLLVFLGFLAVVIRGYFYTDEPVRFTFPLRDGRYYVAHGGNSLLVNYHNVNRAQRYALDIVAIDATGLRARGVYPSDVSRYQIFGKRVYSPCDGTVVEAVDGLPDQIPPETDREHLAGNHIVIACQGVKVLLAHLKNNSLAVQAGTTVVTGQPVGQVGNSGNTTEPHLHIHAVPADTANILEGEGVPILFDEKFPVRNTLFLK